MIYIGEWILRNGETLHVVESINDIPEDWFNSKDLWMTFEEAKEAYDEKGNYKSHLKNREKLDLMSGKPTGAYDNRR